MAALTFADNYRAAGLNPGPEIIRLRQEPFEKLRKGIDARGAIEITRLYFGLPVQDSSWFRDAFVETDPSFSMVDNAREVAVLAVCLLDAGLADGKVAAGLAALTAAAAGNRTPLVRPDFLDRARQTLHDTAVDLRLRPPVDPHEITVQSTSKVPAAVAQLGQDWAKVAELFKQVSEESSQGTQALASQVVSTVVPLVVELRDLREEVEILWWYVGGWSRVLGRPFSELEPAVAAAMAGFDLAGLTRGEIGPAAAPAILQRLISGSRPSGKVTIKDAVDGFARYTSDSLRVAEALRAVPDVCPVLTGFLKSSEIGAGTAWYGALQKVAHIGAEAAFQPLELAMQVYRECLLIATLK